MAARFSGEFRDSFPHELKHKYRMYGQNLNPFTLDPSELYSYAWSPEEFDALELLSKTSGIIQTGYRFTIRCDSLYKRRDYLHLTNVNFPTQNLRHDWPSRTISDEAITDPELRAKFLKWASVAFYHKHLAQLLENYAEDILDRDEGLNTPGQFYRVWPEAASMIDKSRSSRIMQQKLKSSLPEGRWREGYIEEFRSQPYMDKINDALLAMVLWDNLDWPEDYPDL